MQAIYMPENDLNLHQTKNAGLGEGCKNTDQRSVGFGREKPHKIILIGSSTGGIDALLCVLGDFPKSCPPTLIVQHTGATFSAGLAKMLDRIVAPNVREAQDGEIPTSGTVLIAPGGETHLELEVGQQIRCRLKAGPPKNGHRPSVDNLFLSAVPIANEITAAILTGMGKDGGDGLLELRTAGATTIGQNQATSVVFGMPGYANKIGAVAHELPLAEIASKLLMQEGLVRT